MMLKKDMIHQIMRSIDQYLPIDNSSDTDFKDFIKIYKKCTAEPYSLLDNDTTLPSENPLRFGNNLLE